MGYFIYQGREGWPDIEKMLGYQFNEGRYSIRFSVPNSNGEGQLEDDAFQREVSCIGFQRESDRLSIFLDDGTQLNLYQFAADGPAGRLVEPKPEVTYLLASEKLVIVTTRYFVSDENDPKKPKLLGNSMLVIEEIQEDSSD